MRKSRCQAAEAAWNKTFAAYAKAYPELAAEFTRRTAGDLPKRTLPRWRWMPWCKRQQTETVASRKASQLALEIFTAQLPELLGGSADLTGSNLTNTKSTPNLRFDELGEVVKTEDGVGGRHINYGVREFGMAAIMNGVALHGGFIPYGGTFLTFRLQPQCHPHGRADEAARDHPRAHARLHRPGRRRPHTSRWSTRQPAPDPGLDVQPPADTTETTVAWSVALSNRDKPTRLCC